MHQDAEIGPNAGPDDHRVRTFRDSEVSGGTLPHLDRSTYTRRAPRRTVTARAAVKARTNDAKLGSARAEYGIGNGLLTIDWRNRKVIRDCIRRSYSNIVIYGMRCAHGPASHERGQNRLFIVAGLYCALRPDRPKNLE